MSTSQGSTPTSGLAATPNGRPAVKKVAAPNVFMQKRSRFAKGPPSTAAKSTTKSITSAQQPARTFQTQNNGSTNVRLPPPPPPPAQQQQQQSQASNYTDFPIVISKAELGKGMRFHGIRFQQKADRSGTMTAVNPYDEQQFTRPLRLHRRYARDKQQMADEDGDGADDKDREQFNARRAERQAEREANQALIAPSGSKKPQMKQKKGKNIQDIFYDESNPKQQKAAQLRYEETKPWHLEDFDGKNTWIGTYQEPLSESSVLFQISESAFKMVPVERWYTFRRTDKVSVMNSDEVEKHMAKKYTPGRWFHNTQEKNDETRKQQARARRRDDDDDDDVKPRAAATNDAYRADLDELDFEAKDEFQDDDEGLIFGEDDEIAQEVEKKVRDEMREANLPATNMKNEEKDWDEEENKEKADKKAQRKQQKKLRKRIVKHEKKFEYDSDSEHPYSESSDSEDSDEERIRLEEEAKKEEAAKAALNGGVSGASTHGTNTPAGRAEKHGQSRLQSGISLKRPGSPSLSEVSGNESRKKAKGINGRAISTSNLTADGARSPLSRSVAGGYGSGSETDASRAGRPKVRRLPTGSPHEGSPARGSQPGSRAQSPGRLDKAAKLPPPTVEELRAAIPPEGISIKELAAHFRKRLTKADTPAFIALVREITVQDPETKLLQATAA